MMATRIALDSETIAKVKAVYAETGSTIETARRVGVNKSSVLKYRDVSPESQSCDTSPPPVARGYTTPTMPEPAPEAGGAALPEPVDEPYEEFDATLPGQWLILNDCHIPYHDRRTIELAVREARQRGVVGVLLNGDIMDCAGISNHYREPNVTRIEEELEKGLQFFAWLRASLPGARIVYKAGNHEERWPRYLTSAAPELFGMKQLQLPALLTLADYGVEWVDECRVIMLGKLHCVHGHEFRGGGGVMPARWLFLRSASTAICGHFHRTSDFHETALDRRQYGSWSVGCACHLYPRWLRQNKWNHGFAFVEVATNRHFTVTNRRILRDGTVA
jgi:predicted phosphodiesterase